ncbi:MAG: DNA mismatch repair endonuclease MutL [Spirochaetaceae bacterium]|nr:MAG: DNA mismatch repair endonuclease MutL [Spirochaetaceae bacterium]
MANDSTSRRVQILRDAVARKIAAGEVIDRPFSLVRELTDNAIDAGATNITAYIEGGGIDRVRVTDDGSGMTRGDLEICWLPHATSKIESETDLEHITSLGFRGEALASVAAVARLSITSAVDDSGGAKIVVNGGKLASLDSAAHPRGTTIDVSDLFYSVPARRKFLKRPATEVTLCRTAFLEKALPFPDITFRFHAENELRLFLPPADPAARISTAFDLDPRLLHDLVGRGDGFTMRAVLGAPDLARRDRRLVQVYVNSRRVTEFSLVQALEYGYSEYLPGGNHPVAFLFVDVDPELVDFNVHPAKREARFRNLPEIHRRVVEVVRGHMRSYALRVGQASPHRASSDPSNQSEPSGSVAREGELPYAPNPTGSNTRYRPNRPYRDSSRTAFDLAVRFTPTPPAAGERPHRKPSPVSPEEVRYLGQVFELFLIAELYGELFIVDQHAGHERVLFERLRRSSDVQRLLEPIEFEPDDVDYLRGRHAELARLGITVEEDARSGIWSITAIPNAFTLPADDLIDTVNGLRAPANDLEREFYSTIACRAAIKDGDVLEPDDARRLLAEVFSLDDAHCPHGRPVWVSLSRDELFRLVWRT